MKFLSVCFVPEADTWLTNPDKYGNWIMQIRID
jgi:hypothetical protein